MTHHPLRRYLAALLVTLTAAAPAAACTTFCLRGSGPGGRVLFGKNYDWNVGEGMLVVTRRRLAPGPTCQATGRRAGCRSTAASPSTSTAATSQTAASTRPAW